MCTNSEVIEYFLQYLFLVFGVALLNSVILLFEKDA